MLSFLLIQRESSGIYIYGSAIHQTWRIFRIQQAVKRRALGQGRFGPRFGRTQKQFRQKGFGFVSFDKLDLWEEN